MDPQGQFHTSFGGFPSVPGGVPGAVPGGVLGAVLGLALLGALGGPARTAELGSRRTRPSIGPECAGIAAFPEELSLERRLAASIEEHSVERRPAASIEEQSVERRQAVSIEEVVERRQAESIEEVVERRLLAMGTWLRIEVEAVDRPAGLRASEAAVVAIEGVEARLSTWREESELSRLNRSPVGEPRRLSVELASDLRRARHWVDLTGGAFDPGVGALVDAWDLRGSGRRPCQAELDRALAAGGLRTIDIEGRLAHRTQGGVRIEEGAFGKGVGLEAAVEALRDADLERGLVDLGGQVAVLPSQVPYSITVVDPRDRTRPIARWRLHSGSLATSGNSERGIEVDGERLGHLLDPRTGRPAPDFGSLTVWAPRAADADALSTALYVLGPQEALAWARSHPPIQVLVLRTRTDGDLEALCSQGLEGRLELLEPSLEIRTLP